MANRPTKPTHSLVVTAGENETITVYCAADDCPYTNEYSSADVTDLSREQTRHQMTTAVAMFSDALRNTADALDTKYRTRGGGK